MESRGIRRSRNEEEEESYFISMADMMVGLLFIFIILLLYFALQMKEATAQLKGANDDRTVLLEKLEDRLNARLAAYNLQIEVNTETGVLSLPNGDNILFATGEWELSGQGREVVSIVGQEMVAVLPCYSDILPGGPPRSDCGGASHKIDAIFVEGHTDSVPFPPRGNIRDNLDLSTLRATRTYSQLTIAAPGLEKLVNRSGTVPVPILSVSGYGAQRPVPGGGGTEEQQNARNRRIDIRFLMIAPPSDVGREINRRMEGER